MIIGHILDLDAYGIFSEDIKKGIAFLNKLSPDTPVGVYDIDGQMYANIMEYESHKQNEVEFEAHQRHLDIHYVLSGEEGIIWRSSIGLKESVPYNKKKDAVFLTGEDSGCFFTLSGDDDRFAIMYPGDGHSCQHMANGNASIVKKVVVKIKIK